ncbi:alcohol dehydrogenase [Sulfitobacter litoralis]|uniref:alcohol dehydrogenase n=1 Tax=Sulfitobacter litoralis TaxID=335975 RepID=UPI002B27688A|nr:alcohol dehydrogenase [Sulfitobacter litoralis]
MSDNSVSYQLQQYGQPPVRVEHVIPQPFAGEVLVKVSHAGVCHSDVYIMDGYQDLGDGDRIEFTESTMPMPLTMGHEIVGEIVAVGDETDNNLIGRRRLVYPWIGCGECVSCKAEQENHCEQEPRILGIFKQGGYSDYILVPNSKYLVEIDGVDPAWACTLACSGLTTFSALKQMQPIKSGASIAVIGMGGLGLMAVSMARALGIDNIIACDISDDRLVAAKEIGATTTLNTAHPDSEKKLRELAKNQLFGVIDMVGLPATMDLAIQACMKGGRIVLVGLQGGKIGLSLPTLPFKALSIIGTYTGSLAELKDLIPLAKSGALAPMPIQTKPMKCLHGTLEALREGHVMGRVVLEPENS